MFAAVIWSSLEWGNNAEQTDPLSPHRMKSREVV
jgi:hypothetical protein